jgi:hypothetical protein
MRWRIDAVAPPGAGIVAVMAFSSRRGIVRATTGRRSPRMASAGMIPVDVRSGVEAVTERVAKKSRAGIADRASAARVREKPAGAPSREAPSRRERIEDSLLHN